MSWGIIQLLEQSAQAAGLLSALRAGRVAHAYAFVGPKGSGKAELMALCARVLLCAGPFALKRPCGECDACRWTNAGTHPDDILLGGEKTSVDDVRALIARLSAKPFADGRRVVRINRVGGMTPQAQNALLKTLEEPPNGTVFLLGLREEADALPTVRSRCRPVRMPRFSDAALENWLYASGAPKERVPAAVARSGGLPGLAHSLATSEEDAEGQWAARFVCATDAQRVALIQEAAQHRESAHGYLSALEAQLRMALQAELGQSSMDQSRKAASNLGMQGILNMSEACVKARRRLDVSISWNSVLHELL